MKKHTFSLPSSCGSFLSFLSSRWHYLFSVWSSLIFIFFRFFHLGNIRFFISQKLFDAPSIQWALTTQCTRTIFAITACDSTFNNSIRMRKYMFLSQFCFSIEKKCDVFLFLWNFCHMLRFYIKNGAVFSMHCPPILSFRWFFSLSLLSLCHHYHSGFLISLSFFLFQFQANYSMWQIQMKYCMFETVWKKSIATVLSIFLCVCVRVVLCYVHC